MGQTIIVGIGQEQRGDDAVGLLVVEQWRADFGHHHPEVLVEQIGSPGLALIDRLRGFQRAILVDAVAVDQPAGTLLCLDEVDLAAFDLGSRSAHGWGVAESLRIARAVLPGELPPHLRLLGIAIEPPHIGATPTAEVMAAVGPAAIRLEAMLREPAPAIGQIG
jgi:hydrogenase maturation protease